MYSTETEQVVLLLPILSQHLLERLFMYVWYVENVHFLFFSVSQRMFMCTPGVPLTPSNVMRVVREVEKWWGGFGLAGWLYIPKSKQEEIKLKFADDMEQKKQSICYWINTDPLASWRRLIRVLDRMKEAHLADSIRANAEPLRGSHQLVFYTTICTVAC